MRRMSKKNCVIPLHINDIYMMINYSTIGYVKCEGNNGNSRTPAKFKIIEN